MTNAEIADVVNDLMLYMEIFANPTKADALNQYFDSHPFKSKHCYLVDYLFVNTPVSLTRYKCFLLSFRPTERHCNTVFQLFGCPRDLSKYDNKKSRSSMEFIKQSFFET